MRAYLISMGTRIVAFPIAVWALLSGWPVLGWTLAVAALVLPSFAVMIANAVDRRQPQPGEHQITSPVQGLGPARSTEDDAEDNPTEGMVVPGSIIPGTVVPAERPAAPSEEHPVRPKRDEHPVDPSDEHREPAKRDAHPVTPTGPRPRTGDDPGRVSC